MIDTALNWIFKLIGLCQGVQVKVHQGFFNGGDTEFYFIKIVNTSLGNITKSISAIYGVPTLPSGKQLFVSPCNDAQLVIPSDCQTAEHVAAR